MTVDKTGIVQVPGVNFVKPCHYSEEKCETEAGLLTWEVSSYFTPASQTCKAHSQEGENGKLFPD